MIKLGKVGVALICGTCGKEIDGFIDLEEAVEHMRSDGWKSKKYRGEWQDTCPECQEVSHVLNN